MTKPATIQAHGGDNGGLETTNAVWRQSIAVGTNNIYVFSAWAASAYPQVPSRFCFFVNGSQQTTIVELPSQVGIWQNYSALWSSGMSTAATLEVRLLSTQAEGNDFVLDDLAFRRITETNTVSLSIVTAVELFWQSQPNQSYQIQRSDDLVSNVWFDLPPLVIGNGLTNSVFDSIRGRQHKFYRALPVD